MSRILLTGGRTPASLVMARAFQRAGHTVFMAESLRGHLSSPSNAIQKNFIVASPRNETGIFIKEIQEIVLENKIDLLIPTCEEVFYIALGSEQFPCTVFSEPLKKLDIVHNKWYFVVTAIEAELFVPETMLVANRDDLLHAYAHWRELVLKPVYSRFASRTMMRPALKEALATLTFDAHWVAQEYIPGPHYSTYSVCHNGHITAHTTYPSEFTAGQGTTIVFQHVDHPDIFNWVKTYVEKNSFTGQIGFDFIQSPEGLFALECNPRATNGVHLLAAHPGFADAFMNPQMECITPAGNASHMLATSMLAYGLPASIRKKQFGKWLSTFLSSDDAVLDYKDPLPFLLQFRSLLAYLRIARRNGISPLEASTFDIEWNGNRE
jgi:glutathione synthase/RimK-type ligase-like ATP-grasp enzyme